MEKMWKYALLLSILISCNTNRDNRNFVLDNSQVNYEDYLNDLITIDAINLKHDCEDIYEILNKVKTIDARDKIINLHGKKCNITNNIKYKSTNDLTERLNNILVADQEVRSKFEELADSIAFSKKNIETQNNFKELKYHWDLIVSKTDSLNLVEFTNIIDSLGEWIGAEYYSRNYESNQKIEIIIGHFPVKEYEYYTKMAYRSATQNKEYWSRVKSLISFSKKYIIDDMDYLDEGKILIPFRFTEFNSDTLIDEMSDLTQLEFNSIANSKSNASYYKITSSIVDINLRKKLLEQTKKNLINHGVDQDLIKINLEREDKKTYLLYYQNKI